MEMTMGPASQAWGVWHGVRPPLVRAMMKMVMKKKPRRFRLKLKFSSDAGILRDSRAIEQSRGTFRGVERDKDEGDHPNNSFSPCSAHDRRCLQKHFAKIRDRSTSGGKMKVIGVPREEARPVPQGSCQSELHRALERLAASQSRTHEDFYIIPIPNCDRNGNFHPKQCHPALDGQRGKCWCVDRKTGVKLPGGLEPKGELDCHQLADSFRE
ncbi:insulin-like growth factor-binding protein 4 isoform X2 [Mirounga leonina]|uniref:insulin-like growth factor-binding protein 4 isoform X2 n=1 Tax=Mirounga leonina TaxID=9715 RepID=UPI00156C2ABB|nr:insulin-like growth factor-binding protein 4 isoform X2 [Mirounga leonina]